MPCLQAMNFDYDVLVIGSGFGGSVSALRLTEKGYKVGILEAGRRFSPETLPKTNWDVRNFLWFPKIGLRGLQRLTLLKDILVVSGAGVGGGSLVYGNTLYEPLEPFWNDPAWAEITDWKSEMAPFYVQAKLMLGATTAPDVTPADDVLRAVGKSFGREDTCHPTQVGVFFGEPGVEVDDPFFGGAGPRRRGCIECGACIVGCRHNAKNTLERNYLYLAESNGAEIHAERRVVDLVALPGGGYEVTTEYPGAWVSKRRRSFSAEQVIFSAGVLGNLKLLGALKERGRLPNLSPRLGRLVRTNSEAIIAAETYNRDQDYSTGVTITSSMMPDDNTHVEVVRYPRGSNMIGTLSTILVDGGGHIPRQLHFLAKVLRHPIRFLKTLSVRRWSERTVILLVMQTLDNSLNILWKKRRNGEVRLTTEQGHGEPNPTWIPIANETARRAAKEMGGQGLSSVNEVLLDVPSTAHILGGCCIGTDAENGVVDAYQRVFGHPGLHVADASAISANLGVNPSLTITAQTERAMSMWPNKGEADHRPPLGDVYEPVAPESPRSAAVPRGAPAALIW